LICFSRNCCYFVGFCDFEDIDKIDKFCEYYINEAVSMGYPSDLEIWAELLKMVKEEERSRRGRGRKVLRPSDVVKILYEYYVSERKQKDIATIYGVSQAIVSYYVVKYARYVYKVIDKCESTGIVNYAECFNKNMRIIVLANHRKRKRKSS